MAGFRSTQLSHRYDELREPSAGLAIEALIEDQGLQEQITALQEALPNVQFKKDNFRLRRPPSDVRIEDPMMGITMDPAPDPITGDRYPVISIEEEPAVDFKKDPVPAMSMVEQLQQMIADMQAQQQTQAAQQQEQAAARAAQEA